MSKAEKKERRKAWEKSQKEAAIKKKQLNPNRIVSYVEREDGIWEERRLNESTSRPKPCSDKKPSPEQEEKREEGQKLDRKTELKRAGYRRGIFPLSELLSVKMARPPHPPPEWIEAEVRGGMSPLGEEPWAWIQDGTEEEGEADSFTSLREKGRRRAKLPTQPWKDPRGLKQYQTWRRMQKVQEEEEEEEKVEDMGY
jgi:hypothetical protein